MKYLLRFGYLVAIHLFFFVLVAVLSDWFKNGVKAIIVLVVLSFFYSMLAFIVSLVSGFLIKSERVVLAFGTAVSTYVAYALFRLQHWPGQTELKWIFIASLLAAIVALAVKSFQIGKSGRSPSEAE